jgi:Flp pilus assembly protein TadG
LNRRQSERGSVILEFTFMIPVLMLLALGVVDFAMAIEQGIAVSAAAHAGADFGAVEGNSNNIAGMQSAAIAAAPGVPISAVATTWCTCSVNSSATVTCTTICNTYDLPVQYVQVKTTTTVPVLFRFPGLPLTVSLGGSSVLRAR